MIIIFAIAVLLIPAVLIIFGVRNSRLAKEKSIQGEPGMEAGYASKQAVKSYRTWSFANKYLGTCWFISGIILAVISLIILFAFINKDLFTIGWTVFAITIGQLIVFALPVIPLEIMLRVRFDKLGLPRYRHKRSKANYNSERRKNKNSEKSSGDTNKSQKNK